MAANRCENVLWSLSSRHRGLLRVPWRPRQGPTQRPHEGCRRTAPSEDPSRRQPLYRRHQPLSPPRPMPIASRVLARIEHGKPPATPGHNVRRVFFDRAYGTGFTLQPPHEIRRMSRAHGELRPRSAPVSRLGLPVRTPISPRLNRASPRRNVPGSTRRFGRTPPYRSPTPPATGRKRPPRAWGLR